MEPGRRIRKPAIPILAVGLALLVLATYSRVGGLGFVAFDDDVYVYANPQVSRGLTADGVRWAFTTFHAANWHPLTWLSHMADATLFGLSAGWHHRVNALFHLANTVLLFLLLVRMTGAAWPSALAAALFAAHPLHVESVAWVSERKDLLSTLFWLLAAAAYLRYVRRPDVARYLPVPLLFAAGLMCKPMLVTFPFTLLLLDWWPLNRGAADAPGETPWAGFAAALPRLLWEKAPLFLLTAVSGAVTMSAQTDALSALDEVPILHRLSNALVSYATYLVKAAWPSSLAAIYPHPAAVGAAAPAWAVAAAALLICALSLAAVRQSRRRPYLAAGWLWYLGTLVPVLGLVQVGAGAMADRYTYVPLIGIFVAAAWGVRELPGIRRFPRVAAAAAAGAVLALSAAAWSQTAYWRDSLTLFSHARDVTEDNYIALNNLGVANATLGRYDEAVGNLREALRLKPDYAGAWNNLGVVWEKRKRYHEAIACFDRAVRLSPAFAEAWRNLGASNSAIGRYRHAVDAYREAIRHRAGYAIAWYDLGAADAALGRFDQAADAYREALRLDPGLADAWNDLGAVQERLGHLPQALGSYREALRLRPGYAEAWNNMGAVDARLGRFRQAIDSYREALRRRPDFAAAWYNIGVAHARLGESQKAADAYRQALRLDPHFTAAQSALAQISGAPGARR